MEASDAAKAETAQAGTSCRQQQHDPARDATTPAPAAAAALPLDDLKCAICLETLHKPCVNHCGHAFCFWCFHHAMGGLGASQCPLCRAPFKHFAAVCAPLHAYLQLTFPEVAAERDAATKVQEKTEWNAESPDLPPPDSSAMEVR
mgnify:CR=1 FL=1